MISLGYRRNLGLFKKAALQVTVKFATVEVAAANFAGSAIEVACIVNLFVRPFVDLGLEHCSLHYFGVGSFDSVKGCLIMATTLSMIPSCSRCLIAYFLSDSVLFAPKNIIIKINKHYASLPKILKDFIIVIIVIAWTTT